MGAHPTDRSFGAGSLRRVFVAACSLLVGCYASDVSDRVPCAPGAERSCDCGPAQGRALCLSNGEWGACRCETECEPGAVRTCYSLGEEAPQHCDARGFWGRCESPPTCFHSCVQGNVCAENHHVAACALDGHPCQRCEPGEACVQQRCTRIPPAGLSLYVVGASLPSIDPSGRGCPTWDCKFDHASTSPSLMPDPYVTESSTSMRSVVVPDTLAPRWDEAVAVGVTPSSGTFHFEVYDDDGGGLYDADDLIATFDLTLSPEQAHAGRISLTAPVGTMSATLELELR